MPFLNLHKIHREFIHQWISFSEAVEGHSTPNDRQCIAY